MAKAKNKDRYVRVTCAMTKSQLDWIKHICLKLSIQQKRQITPSEAIRDAVSAVYPVPSDDQMKLFK